MPDPGRGIVYFDGYCGLCDRFVTFLALRNRRGALRFAPLQGQTAAGRWPATGTGGGDPRTVVYEEAGITYERSTAVLKALRALGGGWRLVAILAVIPRPLRDAAYDWMARHRFRWFGRRDSCRLPTAEEQASFLP